MPWCVGGWGKSSCCRSAVPRCFQVLSEPAASGDGPCTVLAVVVQESVLAQYETVCEAGLIPQEVDVAVSVSITCGLRAHPGRPSPPPICYG